MKFLVLIQSVNWWRIIELAEDLQGETMNKIANNENKRIFAHICGFIIEQGQLMNLHKYSKLMRCLKWFSSISF